MSLNEDRKSGTKIKSNKSSIKSSKSLSRQFEDDNKSNLSSEEKLEEWFNKKRLEIQSRKKLKETNNKKELLCEKHKIIKTKNDIRKDNKNNKDIDINESYLHKQLNDDGDDEDNNSHDNSLENNNIQNHKTKLVLNNKSNTTGITNRNCKYKNPKKSNIKWTKIETEEDQKNYKEYLDLDFNNKNIPSNRANNFIINIPSEKKLEEPIKYFQLLFTDEFLNSIVEYSNKYFSECKDNNKFYTIIHNDKAKRHTKMWMAFNQMSEISGN